MEMPVVGNEVRKATRVVNVANDFWGRMYVRGDAYESRARGSRSDVVCWGLECRTTDGTAGSLGRVTMSDVANGSRIWTPI